MEPLAVVFGRRIKTLRQAKGLTQEELGKLAGLDYKHLSAIERGAKTSSFDAVERLAKAFDVAYHELFLPEGKTVAEDLRIELTSLMKRARRIDPADIEEFLRSLRAALRRLG